MKRIFLACAAAGALAVGLAPPVHAAPSCPLSQPNSSIKHVVFLQFDNTHLNRDNPNVPSDLEQMPTLYNFLTTKGTLGSNSHTGLISAYRRGHHLDADRRVPGSHRHGTYQQLQLLQG